MNLQLTKVAAKDENLKNKGGSWERGDLKKYVHEEKREKVESSRIREAVLLMDEEDRDYQREKVQNGEITTKDLNHAQAIFGNIPKQDLLFVDLKDDPQEIGEGDLRKPNIKKPFSTTSKAKSNWRN